MIPNGPTFRCLVTGNRTPPSPRTTDPCCTAASFPCRGRPTVNGDSWWSTGFSTKATCGWTARISATPRATSCPTPTTSPHYRTSMRNTFSPSVPRARHSATRRTNATSPASSNIGTASTRCSTPVAFGGRCVSNRPGRCASTRCAFCAAMPTRPVRTFACTPASTAIPIDRSVWRPM